MIIPVRLEIEHISQDPKITSCLSSPRNRIKHYYVLLSWYLVSRKTLLPFIVVLKVTYVSLKDLEMSQTFEAKTESMRESVILPTRVELCRRGNSRVLITSSF